MMKHTGLDRVHGKVFCHKIISDGHVEVSRYRNVLHRKYVTLLTKKVFAE